MKTINERIEFLRIQIAALGRLWHSERCQGNDEAADQAREERRFLIEQLGIIEERRDDFRIRRMVAAANEYNGYDI